MSHSGNGSVKAIFYALGANGGIAVSKYVAAFYTGSGSMMAEAIHSTADCANQLLLLLGLKEAKKPASEDHPLGHHRVTYFWSMIVALLLFFMGGVFSVYEGIERLLHPHPVENGLIALGVLVLGMALEGGSLWGAMKEIRRVSRGKPFLQWFRETRESELMVIAGEDIAALLGLSLAFIAIGLALLTGNPLWDAIGTLSVGLVLMVVAVAIMIEVKALIVGESVAPEKRREIAHFLANQPEIEKVLEIITLAWGSRMVIAVRARMVHDDAMRGDTLVRAIKNVEERLQARFSDAHWVFFEPDL